MAVECSIFLAPCHTINDLQGSTAMQRHHVKHPIATLLGGLLLAFSLTSHAADLPEIEKAGPSHSEPSDVNQTGEVRNGALLSVRPDLQRVPLASVVVNSPRQGHTAGGWCSGIGPLRYGLENHCVRSV